MYRRQTHTRQAAVMIVALLAALLFQWIAGYAKTITPQNAAALALYWQTGVRPITQDSTADTESPAEETTPAADPTAEADDEPLDTDKPAAATESALQAVTTPAPVPLTFTDQEASAITVSGTCSYSFDKASLLQQPVSADFSADGPLVLIVHTHTTESYTPESGQSYEELLHARTLDEAYNMVRVGRQIASVLESNGIGVIHETTINDYPSYNGSYDRMKTIIEENLAKYPTIQMVLDVHRDAAADASGNPLPRVTAFDDGDYAQLMLVVGTDEGGLYHPNWQQNLSTALKLQALLERSYPGLCRDLNLRRERFNQNQTPCSLLVEFGTDGNTLTQALRSAGAFGQALSELILSAQT